MQTRLCINNASHDAINIRRLYNNTLMPMQPKLIYRNPDRTTLLSAPKLPFFYIIQHIPSGKYYAGVKMSKPDPTTFMTDTGYCTSSKFVKLLLCESLHSSFVIRRIYIYDLESEAFEKEIKFLRRIDAKDNEAFLNKTNGHGEYSQHGKTASLETRMKLSRAGKGKVQTKEWIEKRTHSIRGRIKSPEEIERIRLGHLGLKASVATKLKMSLAHTGKKRKPFTDEHRARIGEGNRLRAIKRSLESSKCQL